MSREDSAGSGLRLSGTNQNASAAKSPGRPNHTKFIGTDRFMVRRTPPKMGPKIAPIRPTADASPMAVERMNGG
ncbi:hypothetical protein D3C87_1996500 [compost metagenome]